MVIYGFPSIAASGGSQSSKLVNLFHYIMVLVLYILFLPHLPLYRYHDAFASTLSMGCTQSKQRDNFQESLLPSYAASRSFWSRSRDLLFVRQHQKKLPFFTRRSPLTPFSPSPEYSNDLLSFTQVILVLNRALIAEMDGILLMFTTLETKNW